jgi:hypothetical protein
LAVVFVADFQADLRSIIVDLAIASGTRDSLGRPAAQIAQLLQKQV